MKQIALSTLILISLAFTGCQPPNSPDSPDIPVVTVATGEPAELIINLTSDVREVPESSLMALHFALKARENGIPVTVFLNVKGVHLGAGSSSGITFNEENLQGILARIIENGGNVVACPMCMEVQGVSELMPGVEKSTPGFMMQKLRENPTVFTY